MREVFEAPEVYYAPTYGYQYACKHCERHVFHQRTQSQQYGKQEQRMHHAAYLCSATALHVYHSTHCGTSTSNATEHTAPGCCRA